MISSTMVKSLSLGIALLFVVGCGSNPDGDVAAGEEAAKKSPPISKIEDLPANMPPEARAQAEAAIKQQQAMRKYAEEQAAKAAGPRPK